MEIIVWCNVSDVSDARVPYLFFVLYFLGERPFKCHICQKAFKQSSDLKKHINLHTGANQFKCEECNMEFRRADALRKHKLGHKVGNMPCGHCGKNFLHIGALRAHRAMHNGKTEKKNIYIYIIFDKFVWNVLSTLL